MTVEDQAAWERLTTLLDDDELLWPRVRAALGSGDPWEALIDGLDDSGALAYLDAEDTGMELADALTQLPRVFRLQPELRTVNDVDELDEAMEEADRILAGHGFRLLQLDEDDEDSHALVVVPAANVHAIVDLGERLGQSVTTFD
jgi:hypothetical protein